MMANRNISDIKHEKLFLSGIIIPNEAVYCQPPVATRIAKSPNPRHSRAGTMKNFPPTQYNDQYNGRHAGEYDFLALLPWQDNFSFIVIVLHVERRNVEVAS